MKNEPILHESDNQPTWKDYMGYSIEELQKLIHDAEVNRDSKKHKKAILPKYKYRGKEQE